MKDIKEKLMEDLEAYGEEEYIEGKARGKIEVYDRIISHLVGLENNIVEKRNSSDNIANSQELAGIQMAIEDSIGWLNDRRAEAKKELDKLDRRNN